jgi:hypothetical protein
MKKNLYIADWKPGSKHTDALIYKLTPEKLKTFKALDLAKDVDPILAPLLGLIEKKVAFAAIPESFGEGSACYLINLTSLKDE